MTPIPTRKTPRSAWGPHWILDPTVTFLNHGSFGACPKLVLERQAELRRELESEPVRFFTRKFEGWLDDSRAELASFVGVPASDLVFVPNATTGVNAVIRSLELSPGDEILVTNHAYNACRNAVDYAAERCGAQVQCVSIPFPLQSAGEVLDRVRAGISKRTRVALIDHVTSPTGLVLPLEDIVSELHRSDVDVLVDGAHGPGMLPLAIEKLGVAYYTGNCHKWICAPKGVGFLYVRPDHQERVRPVTISHGANSTRPDRSRFHLEFDWTGTSDGTAQLCVGAAIRFLRELVPGGWPEIYRRNRALALEARDLLCDRLAVEKPAPDDMIGTLASLPLPDATDPPVPPFLDDALGEALWQQDRIEVPIVIWPQHPKRLVRISAALYNQIDEYRVLADALVRLTGR